MQINLFTPPEFEKQPLNIGYLNKITNKKWIYTSNGRSSIYHILKDLNFDKILIPVYICATVLEPLKKLNIKPIFYDLDILDLNPSIESIKKQSKKYNVKALLVASMYGNPANLIEIEKYCKDNNMFLIDDAAQSFGAKLDDRFIGTFGDAGFFSFSPGKPTAGHMGSFFWCNKKINIKRTNHCFVHFIKWLDFYFNRYKGYETDIFTKKFVNFFTNLVLKFVDITYDNICEFEKEILGGILHYLLLNKFKFRKEYVERFNIEFNENNLFKIVKNVRGEANNHKIVIIFNETKYSLEFLNFMQKNKIAVLNGYNLLTNDLQDLPNAKIIDKKVVELPIENNKKRMEYLFCKVKEFVSAN